MEITVYYTRDIFIIDFNININFTFNILSFHEIWVASMLLKRRM
jgi:hypothetical protein